MNPSNNPPSPYSFYRVLLCHVSEIGLKSLKYKTKLEQILITHIKALCKREQLALQSVLNLQDRLLFFFPTDHIPKALAVFRFIVGIQSISPAISTNRDLSIIENTLLDFAPSVLNAQDTFSIRFKGIHALPKRFEDIERDYGKIIETTLKTRQIPVYYKRSSGKNIYIEMREKGAYIYSEKIPTWWGGFPIESNKSMFMEWIGHPNELLAAQLAMRRGIVVIPLLFDLSPIIPQNIFDQSSRIWQNLRTLAKFYSAPLQVGILSMQNLFKELTTRIPVGHSPCAYCVYVRLKLIEQLLDYQKEKQIYQYDEHDLRPNGMISTMRLLNFILMQYAQAFSFLTFYPLTSFSDKILQQLEQTLILIHSQTTGLETTSSDLLRDFDLSLLQKHLIPPKGKLTEESLATPVKSFKCEYFESCLLANQPTESEGDFFFPPSHELSMFFQQDPFQSIINTILTSQKHESVVGQILPEETRSAYTQADWTRLLPSDITQHIPELLNYLRLDVIYPHLDPATLIQYFGIDQWKKWLVDFENSIKK